MIIVGGRSLVLRITVAAFAAAVTVGALAGCSRLTQPAPAAATSVTTPAPSAPAPTPTDGAGSASSLSSIQDDLNAANSANANAGGDIAAGDAAAATNDNN